MIVWSFYSCNFRTGTVPGIADPVRIRNVRDLVFDQCWNFPTRTIKNIIIWILNLKKIKSFAGLDPVTSRFINLTLFNPICQFQQKSNIIDTIADRDCILSQNRQLINYVPRRYRQSIRRICKSALRSKSLSPRCREMCSSKQQIPKLAWRKKSNFGVALLTTKTGLLMSISFCVW